MTLQGVQFGDLGSLKWVKASELSGPGVTVNVRILKYITLFLGDF